MSHIRPPQREGTVTVIRREPLTAHLLRLHFHAPDLAGLELPYTAHALRLWFGEPTPQDKSHRRIFTLRRFDAATATLALDFLLHDDGLASRWAGAAQPGDTLVASGPRSGLQWPPEARWLLAVVDESALPALACVIESLPAQRIVHAVVRTRHAAEQAYLHRLHRQPGHDPVPADAEGAGAWPQLVLHPIVAAPDDDHAAHALGTVLAHNSWPAQAGLAFIAGESKWVNTARSAVESHAALGALQVHASAYWKQGQAGHAHG